jgi:stress response protein SCP2
MIMGFDWTDKNDAKVSLSVIPIYSNGRPDIDSILKTGGKQKAFSYPDGKISSTAILYVPGIPGQPKVVLKLQPAGIPNTVSKLLFVLSAVDSENMPISVKQSGTVSVWYAIPVGKMDISGVNGKLEEFGLSGSDLDYMCCVPFEIERNDDNWIHRALSKGHDTYRDVLDECGFKLPTPKPEPVPPKPIPTPTPTPTPTPQQPISQTRSIRQAQSTPKGTTTQLRGTRGKFESLIKGQKVKIDPSVREVTAVLEFDADFKPDISAFILDGQTRPQATAEELIFFNQPSGASGAITYDTGRNTLTYDLSRIPQGIERIVIVLSADEGFHFGMVRKLAVKFLSDKGNYIFEPDVGDSAFTAVEVGEVYRKAGIWRLGAKGTGCNGGLAQLCGMYGVEVE